jgi:hypothetical protein
MGPPLIPPKTAAEVGGTVQSVWQVFSGVRDVQPVTMLPQVVDVRDVAQLLKYPIEHADETNGERYIASAAINHPQAIADVLREELKDDAKALARIPRGTPGKGYSPDYQTLDGQGDIHVDGSKAKKLLEGGQYISYKQMVVDTAKAFAGLV